MLIEPPRTPFGKAIVPFLLAAVALMACADVWELAFCAGSEESEDCCSTPAGRGAEDEPACDHCPTCLVSHGHLLSCAAEMTVNGLSTDSSLAPGVGLKISARLRPDEIFHPPLATSS